MQMIISHTTKSQHVDRHCFMIHWYMCWLTWKGKRWSSFKHYILNFRSIPHWCKQNFSSLSLENVPNHANTILQEVGGSLQLNINKGLSFWRAIWVVIVYSASGHENTVGFCTTALCSCRKCCCLKFTVAAKFSTALCEEVRESNPWALTNDPLGGRNRKMEKFPEKKQDFTGN